MRPTKTASPAHTFCLNNWGWTEPTANILKQAELVLEVTQRQLKTGEITKKMGFIPATRVDELIHNSADIMRTTGLKKLEAMAQVATTEEARLLTANSNRILAASRGIQYVDSISSTDITLHKVMEIQEVRKVCSDINAVVALIQGKTPLIVFAEMNSDYQAFHTMSEQDQLQNPLFKALDGEAVPKFALAAGSDVILESASLSRFGHDKQTDSSRPILHTDILKDPELRKLALIHEEVINRGGTDIHISPDVNESEVLVEARIHRRLVRLNQKLFLTMGEYQRAKMFLLINSGAVKDARELQRSGDGRYTYSINGKRLDVRGGFCALGTDDRLANNLVLIRLRLLPKERGAIKLAEKGMPTDIVELMRNTMYSDSGLIMSVGPTGAGKSTTMLGLVELDREVHGDTKSRIALEDPVEREVPGIHQIQLKVMPDESNDDAYKQYLTSFVRLDPDFMVMGEIRNKETAQMAAQQSITGHKTLATLHANSCREALERLFNLAETDALRHLILDAAKTIIAQRLYPQVCPHCSEVCQVDEAIKARVLAFCKRSGANIAALQIPDSYREINPQGCSRCNQEGTIGVVPAFEVLDVTEEVAALALSRDPRKYKRIDENRICTIEEMTLQHVANGLTPLSSLFLR